MATPAFSMTRNEIITHALGKLRAVGLGQTLGATELQQAARELNLVVSKLRNKGLMLWERKQVYLFPVGSQAKYPVSSSAASEWTETYYDRTLTAAAALGASTITVSSIANATSGDRIGVILDDGTRHWTTINGAPSGSTITLTAVLPSAAASGNHVHNYTSKAYRPQKITSAFRRDTSDLDVPLILSSYDEYQAYPQKSTTGTVGRFMYDMQKDTGYIYLWQVPSDSTEIIGCTCQMPFVQFTAAADTPDFPQEFYSALIDELVASLHPFYKSNLQERVALEQLADISLKDAIDYDCEPGSLFVQPGRYR